MSPAFKSVLPKEALACCVMRKDKPDERVNAKARQLPYDMAKRCLPQPLPMKAIGYIDANFGSMKVCWATIKLFEAYPPDNAAICTEHPERPALWIIGVKPGLLRSDTDGLKICGRQTGGYRLVVNCYDRG